VRTPAKTLVMSRTLIPVSGPSPLVDAVELRHLRQPGWDERGVESGFVLRKNQVRVLKDADMVVMVRCSESIKYIFIDMHRCEDEGHASYRHHPTSINMGIWIRVC
jgi:hypothetical protein